ncbi:MAG TPA: UDP-N-acetylmuramate dehydrogenase [Caldilineae bacterium]|nr:UDP-N-acetylmuramate dehydrogenase [Caldilineae bacterium]
MSDPRPRGDLPVRPYRPPSSDLLAALTPFGRYGVELETPLAPHTSFRIGGPAAALLTINRLAHLEAALDTLHSHKTPFLLLGGGSNVLISDAGVPGVVILNQCRQIQWPQDDAEPLLVQVEAGASLAGLSRAAIQRGLAGLAWAVSIPGTVGGAIVGNAGAHGGCIADVLYSVQLWEDGRVSVVPASQLQFEYRSSSLKRPTDQSAPGPVVLSATFRLRPDPAGAEAQRAQSYIAHRRRTQPVDKSAGSIFKNPPGDYAGRLIEAAGLKGLRVGQVSVSALHANFIVTHGQATAAEVVQLMNLMRRRVYERFGVILEPEIQFIGDWSAGPSLRKT